MKYFKSTVVMFALSVLVIGACGNKSRDDKGLNDETKKQGEAKEAGFMKTTDFDIDALSESARLFVGKVISEIAQETRSNMGFRGFESSPNYQKRFEREREQFRIAAGGYEPTSRLVMILNLRQVDEKGNVTYTYNYTEEEQKKVEANTVLRKNLNRQPTKFSFNFCL